MSACPSSADRDSLADSAQSSSRIRRPPVDLSADLARSGRVLAVRALDPAWGDRFREGAPVGELLDAIGLRDAEQWLEQHQSREAPPGEFTTVLAQGQVLHVLGLQDLGAGRQRLTIRTLDADLLPALVDARVLAVGKERRLSVRETEVLRLLVTGQSLADIAEALRVAPRTVKFHQANLLAKLGADSRRDLLRVLL